MIILLPVGIANLFFGYVLKDSPCTLCWGQREGMIFIGVTALFIVRYGLKARYLAMLLLMALDYGSPSRTTAYTRTGI